jgi:hypothetical protein
MNASGVDSTKALHPIHTVHGIEEKNEWFRTITVLVGLHSLRLQRIQKLIHNQILAPAFSGSSR